jgi:hypothetical protein
VHNSIGKRNIKHIGYIASLYRFIVIQEVWRWRLLKVAPDAVYAAYVSRTGGHAIINIFMEFGTGRIYSQAA